MNKYIIIIWITLFFPLVVLSQSYSVQSLQKINNLEGGLADSTIESNSRFGFAVEVIGDVDGDGIDDIAAGAPYDNDGDVNLRKGAVFILLMNADGTVKAQNRISKNSGGPTDFSASHRNFGTSIAALGDLNGDGYVDIAVGMSQGGDKNTAGSHGAVYILFLDNEGKMLEFRKISNNEGGGKGLLNSSDLFGTTVSNIGDLNGDGLPDLAVKALGDDDGGTNVGATYIINLDYNGTAKHIQKISATAGGFSDTLSAGDSFGSAVSIGDVDGDGIIDLAIGAHLDDDGGTDRGAVWICFMNTDGTVNALQKISNIQGSFAGTLDDSDMFGSAVLNISDLDGDGINELGVTARGDDDGGTDEGSLWILYLNTDGTVRTHTKLSSTDSLLSSEVATNDRFMSTSISLFGDRNNDGKIDILVGAWGAHDGTATTGEVYVLHLEGDANYSHKKYYETPQFILGVEQHHATVGTANNEIYHGDSYGISAYSIGDLDGDGIDDIVVGAHGDNYSGGADLGSIFIEFLNEDGSIKSYQKISGTIGGFGGTLSYEDWFGYSVCSMGDIDGDGVVDVAVGAIKDDDGGTDRGAVWILFLDTNGTVKSEQKISDTVGGFTGILGDQDYFGNYLANVGDINNDGINDIAVGAYTDDDGGANTGAVWILFLDTNGTVKSHQKISNLFGNFPDSLLAGDQFGYSVTGLGDIDGDNIPDIAVGARLDDQFQANAGAVYILMMTDSGHVKSANKITSGYSGFSGYIHSNDYFGNSLLGGYDLNADGINDLVVGAHFADDSQINRGAVWILYLNKEGSVNNHFVINPTSAHLLGKIDATEQFGRSLCMISYDTSNDKALMGIGLPQSYPIDTVGYMTGELFVLELDLLAIQDYSNNIFINTLSFSDSIAYDLAFRGDSASYTTKSIATMLIDNVDTTHTAKITVEATDSFGALTLLFDVNEVQISNVRAVIFSMGATDTLALDSNLYKISNNGQTLTLYQRDTNEVDADSLLYGLVLQGGLGFSPNNDGVYDDIINLLNNNVITP